MVHQWTESQKRSLAAMPEKAMGRRQVTMNLNGGLAEGMRKWHGKNHQLRSYIVPGPTARRVKLRNVWYCIRCQCFSDGTDLEQDCRTTTSHTDIAKRIRN